MVSGRYEEGEEVLKPEWQIDPLDIFFCSKKNNKLLKLGKGGFGTVSHFQCLLDPCLYKGQLNRHVLCISQHLQAQNDTSSTT